MNLNNQETATILAALRYWQDNIARKSKDIGFNAIPYNLRDHFMGTKPLTSKKIDTHCERINMGPEQHNYIVSCDGDANIEFPLNAKTREAAMEEALDTIGYSVLYDDDEDLEGDDDDDLEGE
jgi:hypothetical protein